MNCSFPGNSVGDCTMINIIVPFIRDFPLDVRLVHEPARHENRGNKIYGMFPDFPNKTAIYKRFSQ